MNISTAKLILTPGSKDLPEKFHEFAKALGRKIIEKTNFIVCTGGAKTINGIMCTDFLVADGAKKALRQKGLDSAERIITVLPKLDESGIERFEYGMVERLTREDRKARRYAMVLRSDAVVSICGGDGTREILQLSKIAKKPILPVPSTDGSSSDIWQVYRDKIINTLGISDEELEVLESRSISSSVLAEYCVNILQRNLSSIRYSCFISYSSKQEELALKLYNGLKENNVVCYFAPKDLPIGAPIRDTLDETIQVYDKLLLILSNDSIESQWVGQEVETAIERERNERKIVLFPIRIDDAIFKLKKGWASNLKNTRNIGDFTDWDIEGSYKESLERLLRDLEIE
ncbi:MAG: toll/interleukin-1 receptor domain-containing protein [Planctomycetota bacterium]|jgi:predicted Rossmann-fold nucleotide-binding protein